MAEDWEIKLIRSPAFKGMAPDRQKVVYQEARNRYGGQAAQPATPLTATDRVNQELSQTPSSIGQLRDNIYGDPYKGDQPFKETLNRALSPLAAGREAVMGIPSAIVLGRQQGKPAGNLIQELGNVFARGGQPTQQPNTIASDLRELMAGRRPASPGNVYRQSELPGAEFPPARFVANNPDLAYGVAQGVQSLVKNGPAIAQTARQGMNNIGSTLENFGLKARKSFHTTPTLDELATMSKEDRALYRQSQSNLLKRGEQQQLSIEQNHLRGIGEQLNDQLKFASEEALMKARPEMQKVMGKASPEWWKLVGEDLSKADDVPIPHAEIEQRLLKKFGGDQGMASQALRELDVIPSKRTSIDQVMGTQVRPYSPKEIWSRLNQERLRMTPAQRAGTTSYGQRDFYKDSLVEVLTNILHERGVDLSRSNRFWAPYAQLRNSLMPSLKPFITEGFQTGPGMSLMKGAAMGKGKANEIAELERRSGQDLTGGIKDVLGRQEANKAALGKVKETVTESGRGARESLETRMGLSQDKATSLRRKKALAATGGTALLGAGAWRLFNK